MNDLNITKCAFSNDMVPYMYGELSASDSSVFESHLLECSECTDEFAAITNARYEVYDWKKLAFDPLATPAFEIPYEPVAATSSWIDKLRSVFAQNWAVPSLGFAALAVIAISAAVFVTLLPPDTEVAVNNNTSTSESLRPLINEQPSPVGVIVKEDSVSRPNSSRDIRPVRIASPSRPDVKQAFRIQKVIQPRRNEPKNTNAKNQNAPRLNEFSEDEDTSLRLAELFEDIETSD